ncbi:iron uptake cluster protein [Trametopsis cervina]|nr:iron uptake cluster protein [Trametopsis cervina]
MVAPRTVVVLGASYGGVRAAQILAQGLPEGWRVVLIDRNTHMNHLYVLPRVASLPQHAHKAFIPYTHILGKPSDTADAGETTERHISLHAEVTSISLHSLTLSKAFPEHGISGEQPTLQFDYMVYALGSHLPAPINLWGPAHEDESGFSHDGSKSNGIHWLERFRSRLEVSRSVVIVGGGALGIQFASDIVDIFPGTRVTLLHSRSQLLPRFDIAMHDEILSTLTGMGVKVVLGERLDLSSPPKVTTNAEGQPERVVRTQSGKELQAGLVLLCTGQTPNTGMMREMLPDSIVPDGPSKSMVGVKRTMQVAVPVLDSSDLLEDSVENEDEDEDEDDDADLRAVHPHIFAVGDAADAFGAIKAGHTAYYQAEVAARNILKLISQASPDIELERYFPGEPAIKVSLGLHKAVYQVQGAVGTKTDVAEDLDAPLMWKMCGIEPTEEAMRL